MSARGPYAKGLAKREEILDVALAHFAERGYDRASVREVARLAGLTQTGLIHHFPTKEDLFLAVLRRRDDRVDGEPDRHEHHHSVQRLVSAVQRNAGEAGLVRLFVAMSAESVAADGPARAFFTERYTWLREELSTDIRYRQARGDLPADLDPDDVATLLVAVADGLQLQWLLEPDRIDMGGLLRLLWDLLSAMTAREPAGPDRAS